MGAHTVRGVSAFRPSNQTRGAVANSALTAPSSSAATVVATNRGMEPPTLALNDDASADGLKGEGHGRSFGAGASGQSTSAEHNTNTYNL